MTHQKILAALDGSDARRPVPFDVLLQRTGLGRGTLEMALDQMAAAVPAAINRIISIRGGAQTVLVWATGVKPGLASPPLRVQPSPTRKEAEQMKPELKPEPKQERAVTRKDVLDIVTARPGISRDALFREISRGGGKAARILISNMLYTKLLQKTGNGGTAQLAAGEKADAYLAKNGWCAGQPRKAVPVPGADAQRPAVSPDDAPTAEPPPADDRPEAIPAHAGAEEFLTVALSDADELHITKPGAALVLNRAQYQRVGNFIARIGQIGARHE